MRKILFRLLVCSFFILTVPPVRGAAADLPPYKEAFAGPSFQMDAPTPSQIIQAVNALRLSYGLAPLNVHSVLMQVAQAQADALAATEGAIGHARPDHMTLGQQLILLGYPLSGDLTLDGYRSENWVAASTVDEAISFWLSDDIHTNTMLSQYRSDIGAGVAVGGQIYVVIDTALQTRSGQQQSEAVDFLTGIPMTQAANSGGGTQSAGSLLPEYIIPVVRNTARPDGDVFHKVQFGQSLWSIAVTYGTTINRIRAWNNLGEETTIYQGQLLLVQKGATQPPPATSTPPPLPTMISTPTPTSSVVVPSFLTMTIQPVAAANAPAHQDSSSPNIWIVVLIVLFVVGGGVAALFIRTPN